MQQNLGTFLQLFLLSYTVAF